ncbi:hypothetical protein N9Y60_04800 [Crocinitomicaceae bacterium]|nr:hypothetical protein [Crocinitomicaceae bacterium]
MKLPVPGFVSQALSSIINNDRRSKRVPFDKSEGARPKVQLKYKEVSEEERERIVAEIIRKRKERLLIGTLIVVLIVGVILLLFLF